MARRVILAHRPSGAPTRGDFAIEPSPLPAVADGEVLLATRFLSVDPMIALLIGEAPLGGTIPSFPVGAAIPGAAVSEVVASRAAGFAPGDWVEGRTGWQDRAVAPAAALRRIAPDMARAALGAAGLSGFTAWLGLDIAGELSGRTVLISGAAGAVGSVAGQIAARRGARVIGLAGSSERRDWLTGELGFDAALDHRSPALRDELAALGGIHVYFDNVGGPLLDAVVPALGRGALILVCGLMSAYVGDAQAPADAALLSAVMAKSLRIVGFNNREHLARFAVFEQEMLPLIAAGAVRECYNETLGLEGAIDHMADMFAGGPIGKRIVRL